jgi:hypothetical protein
MIIKGSTYVIGSAAVALYRSAKRNLVYSCMTFSLKLEA